MFSLIYYSQAAYPFNDEDLYRLASQAHDHNQQISVSGFLQYKDNHFMQYLEGDQNDVLALMDTIGKDARHVVLRTVHLTKSDVRRFDNWHMRYWKESEFTYVRLADLLDDVLQRMSPSVFGEDKLRETITRLVDKMSEHQHLFSH